MDHINPNDTIYNNIWKIKQRAMTTTTGVLNGKGLIKSDPVNQLSKKLNEKPKPAAIRKNKYANNAEYLEVGYMEGKLDSFFGVENWSWVVDNWDIKINSVFVSGHLLIHWNGQIIKRSGLGAKEIQLMSERNLGTKPLPIPEHMSAKALERDFPIAQAQAFKNACKSLGNAFGRHLNRDFQFDFIPNEEMTTMRHQGLS